MKTKEMQARLEAQAGNLQSGTQYSIMPSDCRGDGYDIAMRSRPDESGDYTVADGRVVRVNCTCKVGSRNWSSGIPTGYTAEIIGDKPIYICNPGERAEVIHRAGNCIGNSYMYRIYASIAIIRPDGSKIYCGHTPYWLGSTATYAAHYRSGLSHRDAAAYNAECAQLQADVDCINAYYCEHRFLSGVEANFVAAS
jgi:hypothetical protein